MRSHVARITFTVALDNLEREVDVQCCSNGLTRVVLEGVELATGLWDGLEFYIDKGSLTSSDRLRIINQVGTLLERMKIEPDELLDAEGVQIQEAS